MHVWYHIGFAEIMVPHSHTKYTLNCVTEQLKSIFCRLNDLILKCPIMNFLRSSMWYQIIKVWLRH